MQQAKHTHTHIYTYTHSKVKGPFSLSLSLSLSSPSPSPSHAQWVIHILLRSCYFHHNSDLNNKSQWATPSSLVLNEWISPLSSLSLRSFLLSSLQSVLHSLLTCNCRWEDGERRKRRRREERSSLSLSLSLSLSRWLDLHAEPAAIFTLVYFTFFSSLSVK